MSVSGLFAKIYREIINDQLSIPSMPEIVLQLQRLLRDENCTLETLGRAVQVDVGLSAYLINIANSPVYRTLVKVEDVESAIRMIGMSAFSTLLNSYALQMVIDKRQLQARPLLRETWKASGYRAAIAAAIARRIKGIDENRALLAGLLQDIGLLTVLMKVPQDQLQGLTAQASHREMDEYGVKVGAVIASKWLLDDELTDVIRNAANYAYVGRLPIDLVDVANVARLLSQIGSDTVEWPRQDQAPCLSRLVDVGLTIDDALALIKEAKEDIRAVGRVLVGSH